jgi:hypothetical protein
MLFWFLVSIGNLITCNDSLEISVPCIFMNNTDTIVFLAKPKEHVSKKYEMREIDFSHSHILAPQQTFEGHLTLKGHHLYLSEQIIVGYIDNHRLEKAWRHEPCFNKKPNKINAFITWEKNNVNHDALTFDVKPTGFDVKYLGSGSTPFKNIESFKKHD